MVLISHTALVAALLTLVNVNADDVFWVVRHGTMLATRLDPIISPGGVSGHTHAIIGTNSFNPVYTYDNSESGSCVTANVDVDKSSYWMPNLYRKYSNGTVKLIGLSYANTYYQLRRYEQEPVYEFPPGFRMLAGDASRYTFNESDPAQMAIRYACLGVSGPETNEFPKQQCPDGLRAEAYFPHCWDGVHNWLEGNAHVSYSPEGNFDGGGKCPDSHPKRIMGLFYEFIFHDDEAYEEGARVWADGDDLGYSLHGDFTNGWPEGFFGEIFSYGSQCDVGFSLENCPALKPHMIDTHNCNYTGLIVDEDVGLNGLAALPGNNPFWGTSGAKVASGGYEETAQFMYAGGNGSKVVPEGVTQYAAVNAGNIHVITVKGDPAYTGSTFTAGDGATQSAGSGSAVTAVVTSTSMGAMSSTGGTGSMSTSTTISSASSVPTHQILIQDPSSSATMSTSTTNSGMGGSQSTCKSKKKRRRLSSHP